MGGTEEQRTGPIADGKVRVTLRVFQCVVAPSQVEGMASTLSLVLNPTVPLPSCAHLDLWSPFVSDEQASFGAAGSCSHGSIVPLLSAISVRICLHTPQVWHPDIGSTFRLSHGWLGLLHPLIAQNGTSSMSFTVWDLNPRQRYWGIHSHGYDFEGCS